MAAKVVRRSTRCKSTRVNPTDLFAFAFSVAVAGASVPALLAPSVAYAKADKQLLTAFAGDEVVTTAELDKQRGGFFLPNGATVSFGLEVQQFVNNTLQNDLQVLQVQNHFNVTQNGATTQLAQLPAGGFNTVTTTADGLTKITTKVTDGAIESLVQNAGSNKSIQTVTTLHISTQGFQNALHHVTQTADIINTIHINNWVHH